MNKPNFVCHALQISCDFHYKSTPIKVVKLKQKMCVI